MLCTRCSHPLKPRADRCLRCFALNLQNFEQPPPAGRAPDAKELPEPNGTDPALPEAGRIDFRIDSTPPSAYRASDDLDADELDARARGRAPGLQLGLSFADEDVELSFDGTADDARDGSPDDAVSAELASPEPEIAARKLQPGLGAPDGAPTEVAAAIEAPGAGHAVARPSAASAGALLASWAIDACIVLACAALHVAVAAWLVGPAALAAAGPQPLDTWADLLIFGRRLPQLWAALAAAVALAYSWIFLALGGQTPGMWTAGLRLVRLGRVSHGPVSAARVLARSVLALPSLCLGSFGFVLALVDARGQTLHDKLAGCALVEDR